MENHPAKDANTDDKQPRGQDSNWGFSEGKRKMAKETKLGVALIVILLGAFGFVVYRKMNPNSELLAKIADKVKTATAGKGHEIVTPTNPKIETSDASASSPAGNPFANGNAGGVALAEHQAESPVFGSEVSQTRQLAAVNTSNFGFAQSGPFFGEQKEPAQPAEQATQTVAGNDPFGSGLEARPEPRSGEDSREPGIQQSSDAGFGFDDEKPQPSTAVQQQRSLEFGAPVAETRDPGAMQQPGANEDPFDSQSEPVGQSPPPQETPSAADGPAVITDIFGNPLPQNDNSIPEKKTSVQQSDVSSTNVDDSLGASQPAQLRTPTDFGEPRPIPDRRATNDDFGTVPAQGTVKPARLGNYRSVEVEQQAASSSTNVQRTDAEAVEKQSDPFGLPTAAPAAQNRPDPFAITPADRNPTATTVTSAQKPARPQTGFGGGTLSGTPNSGSASSSNLNTSAAVTGDTYVVEPNDSYWTISKKRYGTARYFQALALYNQQNIPDPQKMRPGTKVLTPRPEVLEAKYPKLFSGQASSGSVATASQALTAQKPQNGQQNAASQAEPAGFFVDADGQPRYRIGSSDTLSDISESHLGRSSRWIQIYQMNRDILQEPHDLKVGAVLRLPPDASRVTVLPTGGTVR